ncbi:AP2 domain-containing protein [Planctomycetes bacterium K23_9]|uniref:AP2 domain protein n=1 Tax=Stieleria marina TaxID=1930275 RepID=A0A517NVY7_9BACT|nr:AP2 domain protein [Planctomycetes bacterium K23_9]
MKIARIELSSKKYPDLVTYCDIDLVDAIGGGWYPAVKPRTTYAVHVVTIDGKRKMQKLHRLILELRGVECLKHVDHRDGDGLNNCGFNLQPMTHRQNLRGKRVSGSSRFCGVSWNKQSSKWKAEIRNPSGKQLYLGLFHNEVQAAQAYDAAARELYGDQAKINFADHRIDIHDIDATTAVVVFQPNVDSRNVRCREVCDQYARDVAAALVEVFNA